MIELVFLASSPCVRSIGNIVVYSTRVCLGWIIAKVFLSWVFAKRNSFCSSQSKDQKYFPCISLDLDLFLCHSQFQHMCCCRCVLVYIGGCGWPISRRNSLIILACWSLRNNAANFASAANEDTSFMTVLIA